MSRIDQEPNAIPGLVKAYLIVGGSREIRLKKYVECITSEQMLMYSRLENEERSELVVLFCRSSLMELGIDFDRAKSLAGQTVLSPDFSPQTFDEVSYFGQIDVSEWNHAGKPGLVSGGFGIMTVGSVEEALTDEKPVPPVR